MYMVSFYSAILPTGVFYTLVYLFISYWFDKLNILQRRTIFHSQSSGLSVEMTEMLEICLPIYSISNLIFASFVLDENGVPAIELFSLIIGIVHAFLPMQKFNEKLFSVKEADPNTESFD